MVITEKMNNRIRELADEYGLNVVVLFGSQATGKIHSKSDVDIAVISRKPVERIKLVSEFSDLLRRDDVEVVNLVNASPTLMRSVVADGKLLYEAEEGAFLRWKIYAIKIWMETAWLRKLRDKKLVEWAARS
ncbi:MAG: nucleotidyltransferase domain-containing protein [bacterium]|nr:nucleotidyltransferase domain-containing protein [bacterium]